MLSKQRKKQSYDWNYIRSRDEGRKNLPEKREDPYIHLFQSYHPWKQTCLVYINYFVQLETSSQLTSLIFRSGSSLISFFVTDGRWRRHWATVGGDMATQLWSSCRHSNCILKLSQTLQVDWSHCGSRYYKWWFNSGFQVGSTNSGMKKNVCLIRWNCISINLNVYEIKEF